MRPIDAEALEKLFEEECAGECSICSYSNKGCPCGLIKTAPTIIDRYNEGYADGFVAGSTGAEWNDEEE